MKQSHILSACLLIACFGSATAHSGMGTAGMGAAGKYNKVLSIGDEAPAWRNLPGTDGKLHSWDQFRDKAAVVVVFTCNTCPYAVDYEDRLVGFRQQLGDQADRVALVAICVNDVEADRLPAMKKRAEEKGFNFPYLYDESQEIARKYGALRTPECFVLDSARKVVYMGSLDDSADSSKVEKHYALEAVRATLSDGKPAVTETPPIGCAIRYARTRRRSPGS